MPGWKQSGIHDMAEIVAPLEKMIFSADSKTEYNLRLGRRILWLKYSRRPTSAGDLSLLSESRTVKTAFWAPVCGGAGWDAHPAAEMGLDPSRTKSQ